MTRQARPFFVAAIVALGPWCKTVQALEPYLGVQIGAAAPTEEFQRTADTGGLVAAQGGIRLLTLADSFAIGVEASPQFAALPIASGVSTKGRDVESVFSLTFGPRLSLYDGYIEVSFASGGGYYLHTTGVVDDDGGGWYIAGNLAYRLGNGNALGLFIRRDEADMRPVKGPSTDKTTYVSAGLMFQHVFFPAP